jgi:hypothetical protein
MDEAVSLLTSGLAASLLLAIAGALPPARPANRKKPARTTGFFSKIITVSMRHLGRKSYANGCGRSPANVRRLDSQL